MCICLVKHSIIFKRWYNKSLYFKKAFWAPSLVFGSMVFNVVQTWGFVFWEMTIPILSFQVSMGNDFGSYYLLTLSMPIIVSKDTPQSLEGMSYKILRLHFFFYMDDGWEKKLRICLIITENELYETRNHIETIITIFFVVPSRTLHTCTHTHDHTTDAAKHFKAGKSLSA